MSEVELEKVRAGTFSSDPNYLFSDSTDEKPLPPIEVVGDEKPREEWGSRAEYLLTIVGFAVGLGNVWRFPYLVYMNGGGAFLLPYWVSLFILGVPMMSLEMGVGQRFQLGAIQIWRQIEPRFMGLGVCSTFMSWLVSLYYNIIITWTILYFFLSFQDPLPWKGDTDQVQRYFWDKIQRTDSINDIGTITWELLLCLTGAWIFIYFCVFKGIQSSGKVVYFTALFPYVVLVILFFRGVTLEGAADGIEFYLTPEWDKLYEYRTWVAAAGQIFYSLGVCFGSIVAFSSFVPRDTNFMRDAWLVALINCLTSFFAGFVVFSCLGFMAHENGLPVEDVVDSGTGLAFVAYPEALAKMPASPFFATMFFLMLFCLGVDSEFGMIEAVVTPLMDSRLLPTWMKKHHLAGIMCFFGWLIGLIFITGGGVYIVNLFDTFTGIISLFIVGLIECIAICWIYGIENFIEDVHLMTGWRIGTFWCYLWKYSCPFLLFLLSITSFMSFDADYRDIFCKSYDDNGETTYFDCDNTEWAKGVGIGLALTSLAIIPFFAILKRNEERTPIQRLTLQDLGRD